MNSSNIQNTNLENKGGYPKNRFSPCTLELYMSLAILLLLISSSAYAEKSYMNIVAASGRTLHEAEIYSEKLKKSFLEDESFQRVKQEEHFEIVSRKSGKYYIATLEPFSHSDNALLILGKVQKIFPDAFIFVHHSSELTPKNGEENFSENRSSSSAHSFMTEGLEAKFQQHSTSVLMVLGLVVIALILGVLFFLVLYLRKRKQSEMQTRIGLENTIEQQNRVLSGISEKVLKPLNDIDHKSEFVLNTTLDSTQTEAILAIKDHDQLLLELTNDLIDFLNIKSNKAEVHSDLFDLNNVFDEAAGTVCRRAAGKNIELIFDIDKNVPAKVTGDNYYTGRILGILLDHAMNTTEKGEVILQVKCVECRETEAILQFDVRDSGKGYESSQLESIFEPFSQSITGFETDGMGLYISQALVKLMGGTLEVSSKMGVGSRFTARLPYELPDSNEKRQYRLPSRAYSRHKMLILETELNAAKALKNMLEYFNNDVTIMLPEGIKSNRQIFLGYEVVFIADHVFGDEVEKLLLKTKQNQGTKIVLVGNMMTAADEKMTNGKQIDARIVKPMTPQRIFDLIYDVFGSTITSVDTSGITPRRTKPADLKYLQYEEVRETPNVTKKSFREFGGALILIVEDNLINQKVLLSLLEGSGIDVHVANDGVEALEAVDNPLYCFDLILMDINMPVMDGYEATKRIRSIQRLKDLPIVSLTGLGLPEEIAKMYAIGMNAHLIKPLRIGKLYTIFKQFVKVEKVNEKLETQAEAADPLFTDNPHLDFQEGLQCASNDALLYRDILDEFARIYANAEQTLSMLLRTENFEEAKQLCLDIKGVSANIGAEKLTSICSTMHEEMSRHQYNDISKLQEEFYTELSAVLTEARKYLA